MRPVKGQPGCLQHSLCFCKPERYVESFVYFYFSGTKKQIMFWLLKPLWLPQTRLETSQLSSKDIMLKNGWKHPAVSLLQMLERSLELQSLAWHPAIFAHPLTSPTLMSCEYDMAHTVEIYWRNIDMVASVWWTNVNISVVCRARLIPIGWHRGKWACRALTTSFLVHKLFCKTWNVKGLCSQEIHTHTHIN